MDEQVDVAALMGFSGFGKSKPKTHKRKQQQEQVHQIVPETRWSLQQLEALGFDALADHVPLLGAAGRGEQVPRDKFFCLSEPCDRTQHHTHDQEQTKEEDADRDPDPDADVAEQPPMALFSDDTYQLLDELRQVKQSFDPVDPVEFMKARSMTNPFESLGKACFLNRSAMKMVNLDHLFGFTRDATTKSPDGILSFVDLCGGPGGFSEYLLWKLDATQVDGFGISLKDEACDWKLAPQANFTISYGADGTGDLYKPENIRHFVNQVCAKYSSGVRLVVSDGGFQDARDQVDQVRHVFEFVETLLARLFLSQVLTMIQTLGPDGHFFCKAFEISSSFMVQMMLLLHKIFHNITIVKPVTSRPASSERYVVCLNRIEALPIRQIVDRLEQLHARVTSQDFQQDTVQLFDGFLHGITSYDRLLRFLELSCEKMALSQLDAFARIDEYLNNNRKRKIIQKVDRAAYYKAWKLPAVTSLIPKASRSELEGTRHHITK